MTTCARLTPRWTSRRMLPSRPIRTGVIRDAREVRVVNDTAKRTVMGDELANGIERAVFGPVGRNDIDTWVGKHVRARLGVTMASVVFRSGRLAAVYGAVLSDGREVAVKVHRRPVDQAYLSAAVVCQRRLADAGFPCPQPIDGPATTDGLTAVIETLSVDGERGDGHDPGLRRAMARSLFEQVELLRGGAVDDIRAGSPAWPTTRTAHGPNPTTRSSTSQRLRPQRLAGSTTSPVERRASSGTLAHPTS